MSPLSFKTPLDCPKLKKPPGLNIAPTVIYYQNVCSKTSHYENPATPIGFLYPLKDYNMNLQPTLLYKITIFYSYTILLETIPRGAKDYDYPKAN